MSELHKAKEKIKGLRKNQQLEWIERGPGNVGGRTRGIVVDPDDPNYNTWYAGSVSGGVWKTTNAGQSWEEITPNLPNLATSALAMSESNPDVMYAGTGEGFCNVDNINGSGIWKTTDRGLTWTQLPQTANNVLFRNITRIIIDPNDENVVLVSATPGSFNESDFPTSSIFRTTDGGKTWVSVLEAFLTRVEDLIANPQNFNTQYATISGIGFTNSFVFKSLDGGLTWKESSKGITTLGRLEIAMAPSDTNKLYISAEGGEFGSTLFVSTNAGQSWITATDVIQNIDWLGGQGCYDNTIAVNPFNSNQIYVGGINIWKMDVNIDMISGVSGTEFNGTETFWSFVNTQGSDFDAGGFLAENFFGALETEESDYTSVELRFGPGRSQKGHRFYRDADLETYLYRDYVDVPFELWDTDNNRQLMVAFRDHEDNGTFDLEDIITNETNGSDREYIFITAVDYSDTPNPNIVANITYKNIYGLWIEALLGVGVVDFNNVPESSYKINWGLTGKAEIVTTNITDGYEEFGGSPKGVHVDQHNIVFVVTDEQNESFRMIHATDGGVWYTDDAGETFTSTLNEYNTSQFYGVDKQNGADKYVGGTQDNGSWASPLNSDKSSDWISVPSGGDGFEAIWHYKDSNKLMVTSQHNSIYRSLDGGVNLELTSGNGLDDAGSGASPFFTKIADSKQDPDLVFAVGASGVWRTNNFAGNWDLIQIDPLAWNKGDIRFSQITTSLASPYVVWTGKILSQDFPLFVSTDGGLTFNETKDFTDVPMGSITGLATHPTDEKTAYALFSFSKSPKTLKTTDLGQTWTDISGFGTGSESTTGFPDVATYCLLVMPYNTDIIWVGTEIGLFETTDGGASWSIADNGLPSVGIWDMLIVNNEVVVATHGRGIWSVELPELNNYEPQDVILSPKLFPVVQNITGAAINYKLPENYDSTQVIINGQVVTSVLQNSVGNFGYDIIVTEAQEVAVQILSYLNDDIYNSITRTKKILKLNGVANSYQSDFAQRPDDFAGEGFEVKLIDGFDNFAIHSDHPYRNNQNLAYTLKTPIRVASSNATMTYEDIAIIEPAEEGNDFGDSEFWDYVIVEATKDGLNWEQLLDGYDARFEDNWLNLYDSVNDPTDANYVKHELNLLDKFAPGDEILIRFRLFSDTNRNGWGWAIKSIVIQSNITDVEDAEGLPNQYTLDQNYPNPFNPTTTIRFGIPKESNVKLKVYNSIGQEITTLVNEALKPGFHLVNFNASNIASGVYFYRIEADNFIEVKKLVLLK